MLTNSDGIWLILPPLTHQARLEARKDGFCGQALQLCSLADDGQGSAKTTARPKFENTPQMNFLLYIALTLTLEGQ